MLLLPALGIKKIKLPVKGEANTTQKTTICCSKPFFSPFDILATDLHVICTIEYFYCKANSQQPIDKKQV